MSKYMTVITELQRIASDLFCNVSKFQRISCTTSKILIIVQGKESGILWHEKVELVKEMRKFVRWYEIQIWRLYPTRLCAWKIKCKHSNITS